MRRALLLFVVSLALSCGYKPLRSGLAGSPKIRVVAAHARVPGGAAAALAEEAATGARAELARWGALSSDDAADRLSIEVVRIDEQSEGAEVVDGKPRARGVRLRVTARGIVKGERGELETPDAEATELVSAPADAVAWDAARGSAARGLARRVGALVARDALGLP